MYLEVRTIEELQSWPTLMQQKSAVDDADGNRTFAWKPQAPKISEVHIFLPRGMASSSMQLLPDAFHDTGIAGAIIYIHTYILEL